MGESASEPPEEPPAVTPGSARLRILRKFPSVQQVLSMRQSSSNGGDEDTENENGESSSSSSSSSGSDGDGESSCDESASTLDGSDDFSEFLETDTDTSFSEQPFGPSRGSFRDGSFGPASLPGTRSFSERLRSDATSVLEETTSVDEAAEDHRRRWGQGGGGDDDDDERSAGGTEGQGDGPGDGDPLSQTGRGTGRGSDGSGGQGAVGVKAPRFRDVKLRDRDWESRSRSLLSHPKRLPLDESTIVNEELRKDKCEKKNRI